MKLLILSFMITFTVMCGSGCRSIRHQEVEYKLNDSRMNEQTAKEYITRVLSQASYGYSPTSIQFTPKGVGMSFPEGFKITSTLGAFCYYAKMNTDITKTQKFYLLRYDMVDSIKIVNYTPRNLFYCVFIRGEAVYYQAWTFSMKDAQDLADSFVFMQKHRTIKVTQK